MVDSKSTEEKLNLWVSESVSLALGYAYTLVRHREAAEDLVQDCYRRLLDKADVYDLPRDGTQLLYRSVTNACINWVQRHPPETSFDQLSHSAFAGIQALADPAAVEPIQMLIQHELEKAVDAAMNELTLEQRAAIELRSLGHSLVDVAEILNITHGNARVLLHRARAVLAERLHPYLKENVHDESGQ